MGAAAAAGWVPGRPEVEVLPSYTGKALPMLPRAWPPRYKPRRRDYQIGGFDGWEKPNGDNRKAG